ncbi:MAG: hypothetical protein MI919_28565 [Holophagales bacterium]|nr:hypothetical protein [Holophagales bacterium]
MPAAEKKIARSVSVALTAVLIAGAAVLPAQEGPAEESLEQAREELELTVEAMREHRSGRIEAGGTVLDAHTGLPLGGVKLVATTGFFDPTETSFRSTEITRRTVDGAFRYRCEACVDARLRFLAEGYHSGVVRLQVADGTGRPPVLRAPALVVTLEPVVDPVTLTTYRGRLVVDADPSQEKVMPLGGVPVGGTSLEKARSSAEKRGDPLLYLQLRTERDELGSPLAVAHKDSRFFQAAVSAVLDFSTADGGVRVYQPRGATAEQVRREMRLAPTEGYLPVLELDPSSGDPVHVYVRIGDRYGRGLISPPVLERTRAGRRLVVVAELHLNPDGTRNLETVE